MTCERCKQTKVNMNTIKRISEHSYNCDLTDVKEEFATRQRTYDGTYDWDNPDLVAKADQLRRRLIGFHQRRTNKLVKEITSIINLGIGCGDHWRGMDASKPFDWVKKDTKIHQTMKIEHTPLSLGGKFTDYPVVDIHVVFFEQVFHFHNVVGIDVKRATLFAKLFGEFQKVGERSQSLCQFRLSAKVGGGGFQKDFVKFADFVLHFCRNFCCGKDFVSETQQFLPFFHRLQTEPSSPTRYAGKSEIVR